MYFDIDFPQTPVTGHAPPAWSADFLGRVEYRGDPIQLVAVSYWVTLRGRMLWPERSQVLWGQRLPLTGSRLSVPLRVPMDHQTILYLEGIRQGAGQLDLEFIVNFHCHRLLPVGKGEAGQVTALGERVVSQGKAACTIHREVWLSLLKSVGWSESKVFEIPVEALVEHPLLARALEVAAKAEGSLRSGEFDAAIVQARMALEAAAGAASEMGDVRKAQFNALWCKLLPAEVDKPKREALDYLSLGLGALRNKGAHGGDSHFQLRRADAELSVTIALAMLRYFAAELRRVSPVAQLGTH